MVRFGLWIPVWDKGTWCGVPELEGKGLESRRKSLGSAELGDGNGEVPWSDLLAPQDTGIGLLTSFSLAQPSR